MAKKSSSPAKKGAKKAAAKGAKKVAKKSAQPRAAKKKAASEDSHVKQANIMQHKNFPEYLRKAYENVGKKINQ